MSGTPSKAGSRIAALVVLIPVLLGMWFIAPMFLPMWRWEHFTPEKTGMTEAQLAKTYQVVFRYSERGPGDPLPWQLLEMNPPWEGPESENNIAIRATIVSERNGEPISALSLGSGHYKDRYFKARAWRFPPGTFGFNKHRPVVVFDAMSLEKASIPDASAWEEKVGTQKAPVWLNDDETVEDGYTPPHANE